MTMAVVLKIKQGVERMKRIRICGDCGAELHKKHVKGPEWGGGSITGYFTWLHLIDGQYMTCPKESTPIILKAK